MRLCGRSDKENLSLHGFSVAGGAIAHGSRVGFRGVSSLLVFLMLVSAEYRHCLCFSCWFPQSLVIACVSRVGFRGVSSLLVFLVLVSADLW